MRIDNLERDISELMEPKKTIRELRKVCTDSAKYAQVLTLELIKQKKGYQRSKTNSMK